MQQYRCCYEVIQCLAFNVRIRSCSLFGIFASLVIVIDETSMLNNRTIILGVTGSIAAYKAADIVSRLTEAGAKVYPVMTAEACIGIAPGSDHITRALGKPRRRPSGPAPALWA